LGDAMKTSMQKLSLSVITAILLAGCSGDDGTSVSDDEKGTRMLQQKTNLTGVVNPIQDVDWYTIDVTEPAIIAVNVFNQTLRYDVDVLVTIYEKDSSGKLIRLAADHFTEDSTSSSSLSINVNITAPKMLYVAVRDLDDNEASSSETYTIAYDIAAPEDDNGTFETAIPLSVNGSCHTDSIGTVGDIDVMRFSLSQSGVYELTTDYSAFAGGTAVQLKASLFDAQGTLIRAVNKTVDSAYRLVESLAAGNYYLLVHDQGKDHFDTASPFTTCVSSVDTAEVSQDDTQAEARVISGNGHYEITGSIDYAGDQDWSSVQSGSTPPSIQVLQIEFDPSESNGCNSWFLMEVKDENDLVLFSKEYSTETGPKTAHIKVANSGEHFISVSGVDDKVCSLNDAVGMPYQATVDAVNVSDDAELGTANNTIENAIELDETANAAVPGKLSYVGDVDWYHIVIPANHTQDQVLEVFIETESASPLEYYVNVFHTDEILDTFNSRGSEELPVSFKTSYLIPANVGNTNADYFIKVVDMQSDEADIETEYTIRTNILPVQNQAPTSTVGPVTNASFNDESNEQTMLATDNNTLELTLNADKTLPFSYNSTAFALTADQIAGSVVNDAAAGTITVNLPWQSGYIDFNKDRDWYQLDLPTLYQTAGGTSDNWYVEMQIQMYSPGSTVEYVWGLYSDHSNDHRIEDSSNKNGYFATNGDLSLMDEEINLIVPSTTNEPMWRNQDTASVPYYLAVLDYDNKSSTVADNDWGYEQPYYIRVTLVYHPGKTQP